MKKQRILNIAHGGIIDDKTPRNTLSALQKAIEIGVDAIEFDVQESKDNHFILYHDYTLPTGDMINKLNLSTIKRINPYGKSHNILTLEEAIALCEDKVKMMIEIKCIRSVGRFLKILKNNVNFENILITSFVHSIVKEISTQYPQLDTGVITNSYLVDAVHAIRSAGAKFIVQRYPLIDKRFVSIIHRNKFLIYVWGAEGKEALDRCIDLNVDGIISNNPIHVNNRMSHFSMNTI